MGTLPLWIGFNLFILFAIALDLGIFNRRVHKVGMREAAAWSLVWVTLSLLFGAGILRYGGYQQALEFFTGYLIEKALSVDNLFLFLVIFRTFAVDERLQHRILEWGILGALVMRGLMILAGVELIHRFAWILYIFGAFLVYAGIHMLFVKREAIHPERNLLFRFADRHLGVSRDYRGDRFFVRRGGRLLVTPLFLVLLVVEFTDVTLALDSVPAVFGITRDPFIVYTSNVLAILGLRAMYFLLAGILNRLRYLTAGLAAVLVFVGAKMILEPWVRVPVHISLVVVAGILSLAVVASMAFPARATNGDGQSAA